MLSGPKRYVADVFLVDDVLKSLAVGVRVPVVAMYDGHAETSWAAVMTAPCVPRVSVGGLTCGSGGHTFSDISTFGCVRRGSPTPAVHGTRKSVVGYSRRIGW